MNYYWSNDRLAWMRDDLFSPLPEKVKQEVVVHYLMKDIFNQNSRFFRKDNNRLQQFQRQALSHSLGLKKPKSSVCLMETSFLYHFACGLMPRIFEGED